MPTRPARRGTIEPMPELPEVETIRRQLAQVLVGQTVTSIEVLWHKSLVYQGVGTAPLVGRRVEAVGRRGKMLIFSLDGGLSVLAHLRMTGQMVWMPGGRGNPRTSATRVMLGFGDAGVLVFNDQRKFGSLVVLATSEVGVTGLLARMGPEPLTGEFNSEVLEARVARRPRSTIKAALLDQAVVAGVGNIYADEVLWAAQIHPESQCRALGAAQFEALVRGLVEVLTTSLDRGGSTMRDYVDAAGQRGTYLDVAHVFGRTGQACARCGGAIEKIRVAGRGTHLCAACQVRYV